MNKRIFTFWTVVLFLLLSFVFFFFDTFKDWGFFAQFLRVLVVFLFVTRMIMITLIIVNDKKELRKKREERHADFLLRREKKNKGMVCIK